MTEDDVLEVRNVKKYFGGVKAVDGCSFSVEEDKITALIGPNGAGKSTLFNLIMGVLDVDEGRIFFEGEDITGCSPSEVSNKGVSRLFQECRLFENLSVKENLLLGLSVEDTFFWKNIFGFVSDGRCDEVRVEKILERLNMNDFLEHSASNLSFGQKRLVEIARSLVNPHSMLLLDEPVAGVNPSLSDEIANFLKELRGEETILLIDHDMDFTLDIADKVVVMNEGKIICKESPKKIRNNPKVMKAYLGEDKDSLTKEGGN